MSEAMPADLVHHWYDYWRRSSGTRAERKALASGEPSAVQGAHDWVADIVEQGGPTAVAVLVALAEAAPEADHGVTVGVGPVEDLLMIHGEHIVDEIDAQARRSPAFARALGYASIDDGTLSDQSVDRLERYRPR